MTKSYLKPNIIIVSVKFGNILMASKEPENGGMGNPGDRGQARRFGEFDEFDE